MAQVETSDLGLRVRQAIALTAAAEAAAVEIEAVRPDDDPECVRACAAHEQRKAELNDLAALIPDTKEGVLPRAEVAAYDAERDADGRLVVDDSITRLLQTVLIANDAAHLLERPTF